jgi:hypothetical protein
MNSVKRSLLAELKVKDKRIAELEAELAQLKSAVNKLFLPSAESYGQMFARVGRLIGRTGEYQYGNGFADAGKVAKTF